MKIYKSQIRWIDWKVIVVLAALAVLFFFWGYGVNVGVRIVLLFLYIFIALVYIYLRWKLLRGIELRAFKAAADSFPDKVVVPDDYVSKKIGQMGRLFPMNYAWWEERRKVGRLKFVLSKVFIDGGFAVYIPVLGLIVASNLYFEGKIVNGVLNFIVFIAFFMALEFYFANRNWYRFERYRTSGKDDYQKH
jgi:hypothetical protein